MEQLPTGIYTAEQAIARVEGWYAKGAVPNRPQRNNNPGDIEYGKFTIAHGATHSDGRFAIFPDAATGWKALSSLLKIYVQENPTITMFELVAKYAPPDENNDSVYERDVDVWCACHPDDFLSSILNRA